MFRARLSLPLVVALLPLLTLFGVFGPAANVAHAEPGPRPTLTPIPPVVPPAPAVDAPAAAPQGDEYPLPTPTPRTAFSVVLTPVAPVRAATEGGATQGTLPGIGNLVRTGYAVPIDEATAPAASAAPTVGPLAWLNVPALLIALIVLDVIGMCVLVRRRLAR